MNLVKKKKKKIAQGLTCAMVVNHHYEKFKLSVAQSAGAVE